MSGDEMATKRPMPGPGRFQWNLGGWFGGQLGCTAWMLVGIAVLTPQAPEVAVVWLVCFAVANAIGSWLWWRRDRIPPYTALQALLLACGINSLLALIALHLLRPGLRVTEPQGVRLADEPWLIPWLLAMLIVLMTYCHLVERSARKEKSRSQGQPSA
jgi:hypothetical protein